MRLRLIFSRAHGDRAPVAAPSESSAAELRGPGYLVQWDPDGECHARVLVEATTGARAQTAGGSPTQALRRVHEFRGEDALDRALDVVAEARLQLG